MKSVKAPVHAAIVLAVFLSTGPLRGQSSNVNLSLGFGIPEMLNAGVSLNTGKAIFGATVGTLPVFDEIVFAAGVNAGLHFAGKSRFTSIPPWYSLAGFNYILDKMSYRAERYTYLSFRAGREMNFSSRTALALEGGIMFETSYHKKNLDPVSEWQPGNSWFPALPVVGAKFIWRLPPKDAGVSE